MRTTGTLYILVYMLSVYSIKTIKKNYKKKKKKEVCVFNGERGGGGDGNEVCIGTGRK